MDRAGQGASASPDVKLEWWGRTDPGRVRRNNEDAFIGLQFDAREVHHLGRVGQGPIAQADFAFAVSDGIGGSRAGEFASRLVVDKITTLLPRSFKQSAAGLEAGFGDVLTELFDRIHRALVYLGDSDVDCKGMEATLSLCWFTPGWMYFGHIGDSRIYYLPARDGGIRLLSKDDTHVGWLLRNGKIKEWEARAHPRRKVLQKALGGGNQFVDPQLGAVACEPGDVFLLCTDGLVENLYDHHLIEALRPPGPAVANLSADPAHRLVDEAIEHGCQDNATAVVVRVI